MTMIIIIIMMMMMMMMMMMIIIIIIIIIKVNYNYQKISRNLLRKVFKKLYNFYNFIRRRLSDYNKITFVIKYLPISHVR